MAATLNSLFLIPRFLSATLKRKAITKIYPRYTLTACHLSTSKIVYLREIKESKTENVTTIEGIEVESPRTKLVVDLTPKEEDVKPCPLCSLGFEVKYTDVLILSQFIRPDGKLLPRSITGVCHIQQRKLKQMVYMAKRAGLMPEIRPDSEVGEEYSVMPNYKWKRYNVYFPDDYEPNI